MLGNVENMLGDLYHIVADILPSEQFLYIFSQQAFYSFVSSQIVSLASVQS